MNNLFLLLLLPVVGAIVLAFTKSSSVARWIALVFSLIQIVLTVPLVCSFVPDAGIQFEQSLEWIKELNIRFHIGVDGISLPLILLTNGLMPLIVLSTFRNDYKHSFYALASFMQSGLLMVFAALDAFTFYVGWEIALIPIYFICALWGEGDRIRVNLKFFVYTFFGSLLMLIAIIYLSQQTPSKDFEWTSFMALELSEYAQRALFWAFFIAFAIKIPIFPFHTWQPDTYTYAPTPGTMLLAGIMLKMGTYALIRWLIPVIPFGTQVYAPIALVLCIIGIVYASIIAFKQYESKTLVAYSSIAHVGLISAGIFAWNQEGLQGALLQMINHGITVVGLFYVLDIIKSRTGTNNLNDLGGLAAAMPKTATLFAIILLAAVGLPLTNGFVGEFLLLKSLYSLHLWYVVFAGLTLIFGAVYMLRLFQKTMLGPVNPSYAAVKDVSGVELLVLVIISILILVIGIKPNILLHLSEASVTQLLNSVKL